MSVVELGQSVPATPPAGEDLRRLKILLVADSLDAGGAERHVVGLAASLVGAGHAVTIGCSVGGVLVDSACQHGVEVRPLLSSRAKRRVSPSFARELRVLMARERFDLVHAHMYASAAAATLAACVSSAPLVVTEHSEATWRHVRSRLMSRLIYSRTQHVIAVSSDIRRRLLQTDRVDPRRVTVIPNALPALHEPALHAALPLAIAGRQLVGVVARLQPEKGVHYLLEAAAEIAPQIPSAAFVVIGEGLERARLEHAATRLAIADRCFFLGFRPDAREIINQLSVLAVPSLSEGTPLVVLEAMAAGIPIVASAVGGIPEQVRHGQEALLVPPSDPAALADALRSVLLDPGRARLLGLNGRQRVRACFNPDTMLRDTSRVYHAVVHQ